jgi:hypothetical protein
LHRAVQRADPNDDGARRELSNRVVVDAPRRRVAAFIDLFDRIHGELRECLLREVSNSIHRPLRDIELTRKPRTAISVQDARPRRLPVHARLRRHVHGTAFDLRGPDPIVWGMFAVC